jgi:glycine hydroxymethyltransferase
VDVVEACKVFGAEYANMKPHCGVDANLLTYWAILSTRVENSALNRYKAATGGKAELGNQRLLGLDYYSGGHLPMVTGTIFQPKCSIYTAIWFPKKLAFWSTIEIEKQAKEAKALSHWRVTPPIPSGSTLNGRWKGRSD